LKLHKEQTKLTKMVREILPILAMVSIWSCASNKVSQLPQSTSTIRTHQTSPAPLNEFQQLLQEDQRDWGNHPKCGYPPGSISPSQAKDRERRNRVATLLENGVAKTGQDYYAAAIIYQHGETIKDFSNAYQLALTAVHMGASKAMPIAAMAFDRWQVYAGQLQHFGTQYRCDPRCHLEPFDPTVTNQERAAWGISPIEDRINGWDPQ
jgi:hypothetical protein